MPREKKGPQQSSIANECSDYVNNLLPLLTEETQSVDLISKEDEPLKGKRFTYTNIGLTREGESVYLTVEKANGQQAKLAFAQSGQALTFRQVLVENNGNWEKPMMSGTEEIMIEDICVAFQTALQSGAIKLPQAEV